jgi:hypothetical protein
MKRPVKKVKRFDGVEGSQVFSEAQEKWLGGADRTDPYILARMRRAVPDEAKPEAKPVPTPTPVKAENEYDVSSEADRSNASFKPQAQETTPVNTNKPTSITKEKTTVSTSPKTNYYSNNEDQNDRRLRQLSSSSKEEKTKLTGPSGKAKAQQEATKSAMERAQNKAGPEKIAAAKEAGKEKDVHEQKGFEQSGISKVGKSIAKLFSPKATDEMSYPAIAMKKGGKVKPFKSGGTVSRSSASKRADGCATKGFTRACGGGVMKAKK